MHGAARLTPELLLTAYSQGVFPMAETRHDPNLFWVSPETRGVLIKSLALNSPQVGGRKIADISLLGHGGKLEWSQNADGLTVKLPEKPPSEHAVTLRIKGLAA